MKINNVASQNFGKKLVAKCLITDNETGKKRKARVYELNSKDVDDYKLVNKSGWRCESALQFLRDFYTFRDDRAYNAVIDNKTGDIAGLSVSQKHYKDESASIPGLSVVIDSIDTQDCRFTNVAPILIAKSVEDAYEQNCKSVTVGFYEADEMTLKKARFVKTKDGAWVLPEGNMRGALTSSQKKHGIKFLA